MTSCDTFLGDWSHHSGTRLLSRSIFHLAKIFTNTPYIHNPLPSNHSTQMAIRTSEDSIIIRLPFNFSAAPPPGYFDYLFTRRLSPLPQHNQLSETTSYDISDSQISNLNALIERIAENSESEDETVSDIKFADNHSSSDLYVQTTCIFLFIVINNLPDLIATHPDARDLSRNHPVPPPTFYIHATCPVLHIAIQCKPYSLATMDWQHGRSSTNPMSSSHPKCIFKDIMVRLSSLASITKTTNFIIFSAASSTVNVFIY